MIGCPGLMIRSLYLAPAAFRGVRSDCPHPSHMFARVGKVFDLENFTLPGAGVRDGGWGEGRTVLREAEGRASPRPASAGMRGS